MGISLFGLTPAATYPSLIKFGDNSAISGVLRALSDGLGNDLPIQVSNTAVNFTGTITVGGAGLSPASGVSGAIQFSNGSAFSSDSANLFWDDTNNRLGIGTNAPSATGHFKGTGITSATSSLIAQNSAGTTFFQVQDDSIIRVQDGGIMKNFSGTGTYNLDFGRVFIRGGDSSASGALSIGTISASAKVVFQGSGSTSATTSLLVQNSTGTEMLRVYDDGALYAWGSNTFGYATNLIIGGRSNTANISFYGNKNIFIGESGSGENNPSALLSMGSTTKGFLPPRMTTTQRDAIATPATGLKVYNTTTNTTDTYDGTTWQRFGQQTLIKGSGSTSATTSLLVQNSGGTQLFAVRDDGVALMSRINHGSSDSEGQLRMVSNALIYNPQESASLSSTSAAFEVQSTNRGFLPPRMTTTQRDAIVTPATGLRIYNTTTNTNDTYNGTVWQSNSVSGVAGAIQFSNGSAFASDASNFFWDDTNKRLGIGTNAPTQVLDLVRSSGQGAIRFFNTANSINTIQSGSTFRIFNNTAGTPAASVGFFQNINNQIGINTNNPTASLNVQGSGSTSATTSLLVQNSGGTELLRLRDDGFLLLGETVTYGKSFIATSNISCGNVLYGNNFFCESSGNTNIGGGQNPATARLQVKGSGSTSATTSLLVQNSAGTQTLKVGDDGSVQIGRTDFINWSFFSNTLTSNSYAFIGSSNGTIISTGALSGGVHGNNDGGKVSDSGIATAQVASAVLEVSSTTRGFLPPRMTTTQKNAIATPASGLVVYDSTTNKLNYNDGAVWKEVTPDGYTGLVTVNATPPVTFDIQNGIIVNVI